MAFDIGISIGVEGANKARSDVEKVVGTTEKAEKGIKKTEKATDDFSKTVKKAGLALVAAFGVKKIFDGLKESLDLFDVQIVAQKSLEVALGRSSKALLAQASALQQVTRFGDESTIAAQAAIAQFIKEEDTILALTPAILDFAAAQNIDVVAAARLVTKTIASSTNALSRYGLEIEGAANSSERAESAIAALNKQFKGQATALGDIGKGPLIQLQNAFGDLKEIVGSLVADSLNPLFKTLKELITPSIGVAESAILQKEALNSLVPALTDANITEAERAEIIRRINDEYPAYLEGLNLETATNAQLRDRLREVNAELDRKIESLLLEEQVNKLLSEHQINRGILLGHRKSS